MKTFSLIMSALFLFSLWSFAQEQGHEEGTHEHEEEDHEGKNRIGFVLEATFVPEASSDEHSTESTDESKGKVVARAKRAYCETESASPGERSGR